MGISFKTILISKNMFKENNEWYVRLEFAQERERPPSITSRDEPSLQWLIPAIQQTLRSILPFQYTLFSRMILILKEEEWEKIENKPDIGEEVTITVTDKKEIVIGKA
jgi:hypothetical protein